MRVLFLIRSFELGGAESQMTLLARGLRARGHEVETAAFYARGPLLASLGEAGVVVHDLHKGGRWDLLAFARRLRGLVAKIRPQALYSFLDTPNLAAAWLCPRGTGAKLVWGVRASNMDQGDYGWFPGLMQRLVRISARRADLIIANSRAGAEHLIKQGPYASKLRVIPNGIDTGRFRPRREESLSLRKEWGAASGVPLVGLVGRIDPMKDIPNFLRAGALLRERIPGLRLVVAGDGPRDYHRNLAELARDLGLEEALVWAGRREDMPRVMNALDLLLLSSAFGEGSPNVVGEAMAAGVPCVVTNVGDAAWLVGDSALTVPSRNPAALASSALAVLELPYGEQKALGQRLRSRVEENFSLPAMIAASEAKLLGLIGEGG